MKENDINEYSINNEFKSIMNNIFKIQFQNVIIIRRDSKSTSGKFSHHHPILCYLKTNRISKHLNFKIVYQNNLRNTYYYEKYGLATLQTQINHEVT